MIAMLRSSRRARFVALMLVVVFVAAIVATVIANRGSASAGDVTTYLHASGAAEAAFDPSVRAGPLPLHYDASSRFHRTLFDVSDGALHVRFLDAFVPAGDGLLTVTRTYRSNLKRTGVFGIGFTSNLDVALRRIPGIGDVEIAEADGRSTRYHARAGGFVAVPPGYVPNDLHSAGAGFERDWRDGTRETFDSLGRLVRVERGANAIELDYPSATASLPARLRGARLVVTLSYLNGLISELTDPLGRKTQYTYEQRRLAHVADSVGRKTDFVYDGARLTKIGLANGSALAFAYDSAGTLRAVDGPGVVHTAFRTERRADGITLALHATDGEGRDVTTEITPAIVDGKAGFQLHEVSGPNVGYRTFVSDSSINASGTASASALRIVNDGRGALVSASRANDSEDWRAFAGPGIASQRDPHVQYDTIGRPIAFRLDDGRTERWTWDAADRIVSWTDSSGAATKYDYDADDRLTAISRPDGSGAAYAYTNDLLVDSKNEGGAELRFAYDRAGTIASVTDTDGHVLRLKYDRDGRPLSIDGDPAKSAGFSYDGAGRIASMRTGDGRTITYRYDAGGRLASVDDSAAGTARYTYDAAGELASIDAGDGANLTISKGGTERSATLQLPGGSTASYRFDGAGRLTHLSSSETAADYSYDASGKLTTERDADGKTTRFDYDAAGRPTVVDGGSRRITVAYKDDGSSVADMTFGAGPSPPKVSIGYDARGRVVSRTADGGNTANYSYTPQGQLASITDPRGTMRYVYGASGSLDRIELKIGDASSSTVFHYDARGRIDSVTHDDGTKDAYRWDDRDRVAEHVDALGIATRFDYDGAGRLRQLRSPAGDMFLTRDRFGRITSINDGALGTSRYEFDDAKHAVAFTDPAGVRSVTLLDGSDREISRGAPLGRVLRWTYDAGGKLTTALDPMGAPTTYEYDSAGRRTTMRSPLGKTWKTHYAEDGSEVDVTGPSGARVTTEFDPFGRMTATKVGDAVTRTMTYDGFGRTASVTETIAAQSESSPAPSASSSPTPAPESFSYDGRDAIVSHRDSAGVEVGYTYDVAGRLTGLKIGSDRIGLRYDRRGLIDSVDGAAATTRYQYDPLGRIARVERRDGPRVDYGYDRASRVVSIAYRSPRGALIDEERYRYDVHGDLVAATSFGETTRYKYDALDRLVEARSDRGAGETYAYDAAGNITSAVDASSISYNADQELTKFGPWAATYDASGGFTGLEGGPQYRFDAALRLAVARTKDGVAIGLAYDAAGQLTDRRSAAGSAHYAYLGDMRFAVFDGSGNRSALYVPSALADQWDTVLIGGKRYYPVRSSHGNLLAVVDGSGRVVRRFRYDSYGRTLAADGTLPVDAEFAARPIDAQIGLVKFGLRYYSPETRRFITRDPVGPDQDGNVYAYALGNPLRFSDTDGAAAFAKPTEQSILTGVQRFAYSPSQYQRNIANQILTDYGSGKFDFTLKVGTADSPFGAWTPGTNRVKLYEVPHLLQKNPQSDLTTRLVDTLAHEHGHWLKAPSLQELPKESQTVQQFLQEYKASGRVEEFFAHARGTIMDPYGGTSKLLNADDLRLLVNFGYSGKGGQISDAMVHNVNGILRQNAIQLGLLDKAHVGITGLDPYIAGDPARVAGLEAYLARFGKVTTSVAGTVLKTGLKALPFLPSAIDFARGIYNGDPDAMKDGFIHLGYGVPVLGEAMMAVDIAVGVGGWLGQKAADVYIAAKNKYDAFFKAFDDINKAIAAQDDEDTQRLKRRKRRGGDGASGGAQPMQVVYWNPPSSGGGPSTTVASSGGQTAPNAGNAPPNIGGNPPSNAAKPPPNNGGNLPPNNAVNPPPNNAGNPPPNNAGNPPPKNGGNPPPNNGGNPPSNANPPANRGNPPSNGVKPPTNGTNPTSKGGNPPLGAHPSNHPSGSHPAINVGSRPSNPSGSHPATNGVSRPSNVASSGRQPSVPTNPARFDRRGRVLGDPADDAVEVALGPDPETPPRDAGTGSGGGSSGPAAPRAPKGNCGGGFVGAINCINKGISGEGGDSSGGGGASSPPPKTDAPPPDDPTGGGDKPGGLSGPDPGDGLPPPPPPKYPPPTQPPALPPIDTATIAPPQPPAPATQPAGPGTHEPVQPTQPPAPQATATPGWVGKTFAGPSPTIPPATPPPPPPNPCAGLKGFYYLACRVQHLLD